MNRLEQLTRYWKSQQSISPQELNELSRLQHTEIERLRAGFQWLADLAEDEDGITINVAKDGEIDIGQECHGRNVLYRHIDLADLCTQNAKTAP